MRLSERVVNLRPSATLAVTAKAKALRSRGVDIIGFGAGEPDFDTPQHVKDAAIGAINDGWTRYVASAGDPETCDAIARKLCEENGLDVAAANVVITPGVKHAIYLASHALIEPSRRDEIIIPTPAWVSYEPIAELCGGVVVEAPTTPETGFRMTPAQLRESLTPRSRILMINSPSNPCGTMYTPDELAAIAAVVNEHNARGGELVVFSDEIYEKLTFGATPFESIGRFVGGDAVVTFNGLSKSCAMTGWRIGYAAAPVALADAMARLQSQMNTSLTACCYPAATHALRHGGDDVERMREAFARRAEIMFDRLAQIPALRAVKPAGAFYVFPDVSATFGRTTPAGALVGSALTFADALLEEAHVAVVPGEDFGGCGGNHVRVSFAMAENAIREGLDRIHRFIDGLSAP